MIEIKNLITEDNGRTALEIEKLALEEGKITAIVGLNGSGKSTLLKSILGLNPFKGEILIDGKSLHSLTVKKRASLVSYLPQSSPSAAMDIYTLVSHGRFPHLGFSKILGAKDITLVEKALKLTDLWNIRYKGLAEISGGQRQRAYLAMVIAQNTKYILLDEPATYMDIKHQIEIMSVLKELVKEGRGIIFASHDLPQSFTVSNNICLLKTGHLAACGKPETLSLNYELMKSVMEIALAKDDDDGAVYSYKILK